MTQITPHLTRLVTSSDPVPAPVQAVCRLSMLDWMACGIAGASEPVSRIVRAQVLEEEGARQAVLFGGGRAPVRAAALVNGTVSHALDYDDTHFAHIGHPSVAVLPAILALAEQRDTGLPEVVDAAAIGMEASVRAGIWLGRAHYQAGFHMTATAGAIGAAAGTARLLGLPDAQVAQALGLAATRAAGLKAHFGTMGKPWNAGIAASSGVEAVQLVARGFEANPDALDGPHGFGATHFGESNDPGIDWQLPQVRHKFHACCHGLHAALETLGALDLAAPEVAAITLRTHPRWLTVCNQPAPTTGLGAKFSYRTALALGLTGRDTARLSTFSDALAVSADVVAARELVTVMGDESLTEEQAALEVLRRDGQRLTAFHDLDAPVDMAARTDRVQAKASALLGDETAASLRRLIASDRARAADLATQMEV
ncbi:MAG: MmgE/PrpD family protein [Rhodobacteraceae bacterium]|nr:MmgE/PrpD family protein [Paracoccaceae bacterium]